MVSAIRWSSAGESAVSTFATPGSFAAAAAAASSPLPATRACTSPSFCAAATALRDGCLIPASSYSNSTRLVIAGGSSSQGARHGSDHFRFGTQLRHQFGHRSDLDAGLALRWFGNL